MASYSNLVVEQGATFTASVILNDNTGSAQNLQGYTANSQMRKSYYSSNATTFTAAITDASNGEITISLTAAQTANVKAGRYVYDLIVSNTVVTTRVVEGIVTVYPEVTR